jgi:hypothetical protein
MIWCVPIPSPFCIRSSHVRQSHPSNPSAEYALILYLRKRAANTNSTPNFSRTSQSLTTSSHSRLRRRSTRFDGADDRTQRTSYSRRMVRRLPTKTVACQRSLICLFCMDPHRQDNQVMESLRKVVAGGVRIQHERWTTSPPTTIIKAAFAITTYATSGQHHRCRTA